MSSTQIIVLITGANGGIGFDTVAITAGASADYHVIMCSRSEEKGSRALADLQARNLPGSISLLQLDVTDEASIAAAVEQVTKDFGRLDILVNNAGVVSSASTTSGRLSETFGTNLFAPLHVTEAFLPLLKESSASPPRLLYITSDLSSLTLRGDPSHKHYRVPGLEYRMSKAALNMLTVCHAVDFKAAGIKVFAVNPGYTVSSLGGEHTRAVRVKNGAIPSEQAARLFFDVIKGAWDHEEGKLLSEDGVTPW